MSDSGSPLLRLFKLIPMLMAVAFLAWCSSNRGSRQDVLQVRTELVELMSASGLISGPSSDVDLGAIAKQVGTAGMNRLLYDNAATASLPAMKWMVKNGAEPRNVGALVDEPLLHKVAKQPQFDRLEYFLNLGLDAAERGRDGMSLMHVAAQGGLDERILGLLTSKGLTVSDVSRSGKQPLHVAHFKSIAVLAKAGADMSAKDNLGRTPLHLAAMGRSDAVIDTLLAAGAPRAARDNDNLTPRELAQEMRKNSVNRYRDMTDKL